jgi:hypothetical protein
MEASRDPTGNGEETNSTGAQAILDGAAAATAVSEAARTAAAAEGAQRPEAGAVTEAEATGAAVEAAHGEMKESTMININCKLFVKKNIPIVKAYPHLEWTRTLILIPTQSRSVLK